MNKLSQSSPHVSFRDYQNAYIIRSVPRPACSVVSATTCSNVAEHAVLRRSPIGHGEATLKACRNPGVALILTIKPYRGTPVATAELRCGRELLHPRGHGCVVHRLAALGAQRRLRHREQRAGPLRRATTLPAIRNLQLASRHAHQFLSLLPMTSISRSRSRATAFKTARPFGSFLAGSITQIAR